MLSSRKSSQLLSWLSLLLWAAVFHASCSFAQQDDADDEFEKPTVPGARTFDSTCAGCHGLDGRGTDKGANIAGSDQVRHLSDPQLSAIISNGVAGTGMPAFHSLSARQIGSLVDYLRILQGKVEARTPPGDATRGKEIFFGKGECSSCHTISGEGGFLGPELSAYGSGRSAKAVRNQIVQPARNVPAGYRSAVLTTGAGDRLEGIIRNEDNFSVQLEAKDGSFHFFEKSELRALEPLSQSLMPTNYSERLSADELNDLVSYLMTAAPAPARTGSSHKLEDPAP